MLRIHILPKCLGFCFTRLWAHLCARLALNSVFGLVAALLLCTSLVSAEQVSLAWDDSNNDPTEVGGYWLYYWQSAWEMPDSVDVGLQTTYTLTNLEAGQTYTFAVTVHDGQGGRESILSNEVSTTFPPANNPPVAYDGSLSTAEDTPVSGSLVGTDPDNDPLTYRLISMGSQGTAVLTDVTSGAYTYTPQPHATGSDTFTFQVSDGKADSNIATVTVTITPVNDAPVAAADSATTPEDTSVSLSVLANDSDADGNVLTVTAVSPATAGMATTDGVTVTYTPSPDFAGTDTFTYTVSDGQGATDVGTVTVSVAPVNDAPVAAADSATTPFETMIAIPVLVNDYDPNDTVQISSVTQPAGGAVTFTVDGEVIYTPQSGFFGADMFTYTIENGQGGTATVSVSVLVGDAAATSLPPTAVADASTTSQDTPLTISVLPNDYAPDADPLTIIAVDSTTDQGGMAAINDNGTPSDPMDDTIDYIPAVGFTGADTFTYTIEDGNGGTDSAWVLVVVTAPSADPVPTAVGDSVTIPHNTDVAIAVLSNDTHPTPDMLTLTVLTHGAHGIVEVDNNATPEDPTDDLLIFMPDVDFIGHDTFAYTIVDANGDSARAAVTVTMTNTAPMAADDTATTEAAQPVTLAVLANDSDPDGDELTIESVTPAANGTVVLNADSTLTYTSNTNFDGTDTFTYTVSDGHGGTDVGTVTVTITPVNDGHCPPGHRKKGWC